MKCGHIALCVVSMALVAASVSANSRVRPVKARITHLESALWFYKLDMGRYPTAEEGLVALLGPPADLPANDLAQYPKDGYLKSRDALLDPWGEPFHFRIPGVRNPKTYDLWSTGPDRSPGGTCSDADVGNWSLPPPSPGDCPGDHPVVQGAIVGFTFFAAIFVLFVVPTVAFGSIQAARGQRPWRRVLPARTVLVVGALSFAFALAIALGLESVD